MPTPLAGRFTLVDPVGTGMSGTVWRAFDHRLGGYCAAKLVRPADAGLLLRVVREQGLRLEHPHVSSPYTWVADGDVLIAMELYAGGSLASLIRDHGALPEPYVAAILGQLLDALEHVHDVGLVHRDVKPANVLLEVTGQGRPHCLLGDFGLALPREGPRLTEAGHVVGTWGYLPPEAATGAPPDVRRDLYALGILAWQLLSGSEDPPDGPPSVPADAGALWDLVGTLTEAEPQERPRDAACASARLREIAPGLGPVTPASTADGEPIEVFDVVGPLPGEAPEGPVLRGVSRTTVTWPDGRVPAVRGASSGGRTVAVSWSGSTPQGPTAPPVPPVVTAPPVLAAPPARPVDTPPVPPLAPPSAPAALSGLAVSAEAPSVSLWLRAAERNAADPAPRAPVPVGAPAGNRRGRRRVGSPGKWAFVGGVVAVAAVTTALIASGDEDDPADPGPTQPSAPALTRPSDRPSGTAGSQPSASPPVPAPLPRDVAAGTPCDWYDVSAEVRTPEGKRMRCTYRDDGTYRWMALPTP
ncbi:serine/threonine-protein kinase [Embleya sp. NPDC001921]